MASDHQIYRMEEPPLDVSDPQVLRDYLSRELKRIENSARGVDLEVESRWNDYTVSGLALGKGASAPDQVVFRDGLELPGFAGTGVTVEQAFFTIHILHDIKPGSTPTFHVHWSHAATAYAANTAVVKWQVDYSIADPYDATSTYGPITSLSIEQTAAEMYVHHVGGDLSATMAAPPKTDQVIIGRIYRDPADAADTFGYDAHLIQIDMHYEMGLTGTAERNGPFKEFE